MSPLNLQTDAPIDLALAIGTFLLFKRAEGLRPETLTWYRGELSMFSRWIGPMPLANIRPLHVVEWINSRQAAGLSTMTVEGDYRALLAFFNWCERSPDMGKPPSPIGHGDNKTVKRPKTEDAEIDFVSFEEYLELTQAIDLVTWLDYRDWCMVGVMFWCGVRSGELLRMTVGDIDFDKALIRVPLTKTRKPRTVFLLDDLLAGLRQYLTLRPPWAGPELWLAYNQSRTGIAGGLTKTGLRMMLTRRCRRAGTRFLNPHLFRDGFAMAYLNNGAELKAVSTLLGHSSVKTTERHYAEWLEAPLRRVHEETAARIVGRA